MNDCDNCFYTNHGVLNEPCTSCVYDGGSKRYSNWVAIDVFKKIDDVPLQKDVALNKRALDIQVAGNHYKELAIQPVEYIHANNIGYFEGNVIKYVSRWRSKNGIKDLEKAKHYIDLLIELEGKTDDKSNSDI
jgi:hypothetical protein